MSADLALLGGEPAIASPLVPYPSIGPAEREAVRRVLDSGTLSGFYGSWGDEYWGGPEVKEFEEEWASRFGVRHAVSVNSATSGLIAAMAAIGLSPGDEVIVPPYTMSATVMAPLFYGGIPVFVDIEPDTFCLDVAQVRAAITQRTRAIIAVDLFGHPAPLRELRELADERGLYLIEDAAQAPLASEDGRLAGTVGHIGVFSLNYHKHIHTGEGGIVVTQDEELGRRVQLVRNHGENVVAELDMEHVPNMVGHNMRLTELQAAIGRAQLASIDEHIGARTRAAKKLTETVEDADGLTPPTPRAGCDHVYYVWALRVNAKERGFTRSAFSKALAAEGFPHGVGYCEPLYRLPAFRHRQAIGRDGWPFTLTERRYDTLSCPVTERMHKSELILFEPCAYDLRDDATLERLVTALEKVTTHGHKLTTIEV